ncbi:hypothetical protein [Streptomyces platensis]|uniref:hypothetical protein n=1 Tax=Streptomyces platensis TaxID=58346 RepID=UPI002E265E51
MNHATDRADALREGSRARLAARQDEVIALSHSLHAEPELAYEETRSAAEIANLMEGGGFAVARGVCDLPTAFTATAGSGDLVIGICAECDALPDIGHASGHNVNGAAAVAAGPVAGGHRRRDRGHRPRGSPPRTRPMPWQVPCPGKSHAPARRHPVTIRPIP